MISTQMREQIATAAAGQEQWPQNKKGAMAARGAAAMLGLDEWT
jgi:hypothetical protein